MNRFQYDKNVLCKSEIDFIPPVFVAMITDNCDLRCPTCYLLLQDPDIFVPSYISPDRLLQALEKHNKKKKLEVIFLTGGEPLLHPQIDDIIDICKGYNCSVKISTNGILLKNKISSLSKLDYVNVSMDGYDYESYKKYRGGTQRQFDLVIEGLKALKEKGVYFSMSYLLSVENLSETDKMIELAEDIKPDFVSFHNINPHGSKEYSPLIAQEKNTQLFLEKILDRCDYPFNIDLPVIFDPDSPLFRNTKCIQPWYQFNFNSVGDIAYCCQLVHDKQIGNLFTGYNVNLPKMVKFRKDIMKGALMKNCLYCQRRFLNKEFGNFDSNLGRWFIKQH